MDTLLRRGLKLGHLRIVAALADTGQIGRAADRVGITQPAASRLLAEVERITGHPVHARAGRGIALTAQGAALARRATRILVELADTAAELDQIGRGGHGHVRIGAVTGPALDRVLPALRAARLALPGLTTEVEVGPSDHLGAMLLAGRIDFALARRPAAADPALFDITMIADEPVSLVARQDHSLTRVQDLRPAALLAYDWVLPGQGAILRDAVLARLAALGLPAPPGRLATSSFLLTLAMLQNSNAIAPLAAAVARRFATGPGAPFAVLPIDLGIRVAPYGLLSRAHSALPPAALRLRDLILATKGDADAPSAA